MSEVTITYNRIDALLLAIQAAEHEAVRETADDMAGALRQEMDAPKSGRLYGSHQASAPGEVPANWYGPLKASIRSAMTGPGQGEYAAGNGAPYLTYLEYGTVKMAPRPMMIPSVDIAKPLLRQNVTDAIKKVT